MRSKLILDQKFWAKPLRRLDPKKPLPSGPFSGILKNPDALMPIIFEPHVEPHEDDYEGEGLPFTYEGEQTRFDQYNNYLMN